MARQTTHYNMTVPETGDSPDVSVLANNFDTMDTLIYDHKQDGVEAAEAYLEDALEDLTTAASAANSAAIRAETAAGAVDQRLIPQVSATVTSVPYDPSSPTGGASVTQDGTTLQPQFHFSIPRGADGPGTLYLQNADPAQVTTITVVDGDDIDEAVDEAVARGIDDIVDAAVSEAIQDASFAYQIGNVIYPVGSIYVSTSSASPATLFGGTWQRIEGKFLLAATDGGATGGQATGDPVFSTASVAAGSDGGEATHTLDITEMPSHTHELNHDGKTYANALCWAGSGGNRNVPTGSNAMGAAIMPTGGGQAHNNMPPFLAVYV